jgi:chromosome segregation ATPase
MGPRAMDLNESFQQLEEKLTKAGEVFKRAVADKHDLEKALEKLKHDTGDSQKRLEAMQHEIQMLRREREEVRIRIEKLLGQIEQLTGPGSTG